LDIVVIAAELWAGIVTFRTNRKTSVDPRKRFLCQSECSKVIDLGIEPIVQALRDFIGVMPGGVQLFLEMPNRNYSTSPMLYRTCGALSFSLKWQSSERLVHGEEL
jgi:hypothetical protein